MVANSELLKQNRESAINGFATKIVRDLQELFMPDSKLSSLPLGDWQARGPCTFRGNGLMSIRHKHIERGNPWGTLFEIN